MAMITMTVTMETISIYGNCRVHEVVTITRMRINQRCGTIRVHEYSAVCKYSYNYLVTYGVCECSKSVIQHLPSEAYK